MSAEAIQAPVTNFFEIEKPPRFIHLKIWIVPELNLKVPYLAVKDGENYLPFSIPDITETETKTDKDFWSFRNFLPRSIAAQYYAAQQAGIKNLNTRRAIESGYVCRKLLTCLRHKMNLKGTELTWDVRDFPRKK